MLPNFLCIGAPRAGTTWLAKNLMEHPDIYIPRKKELHFFDSNYDKGIEFYTSYFDAVSGEKAVGEITPAYLASAQAPALIKKHLPDVKLIVILRDPVGRLYSRYLRGKGNYKENENLTFEEKIKAKPFLVEEGFYYDHLLRYYEHFPKERILILLYDDLADNSDGLLRSVYEYLDVDASFTSPVIEQKINKATQQKRYAKSRPLWYFSKVLDRLGAAGLADSLRGTLEPELPSITAETRAWLIREVYGEKNELLQGLIGRDLSNWNRVD